MRIASRIAHPVGQAVERADTFPGQATFGQVLVDDCVAEMMTKGGARGGLDDGSAGTGDRRC